MPEEPFFARIFGSSGPSIEATAVAYIGFAGTLTPAEADQPIAICRQGITDPNTGAYTCGVGRMINSGQQHRAPDRRVDEFHPTLYNCKRKFCQAPRLRRWKS